jgi:5-guanidino-2-oxopentanoate decarboxylase
VRAPRRWLHPAGYGALGYALPAAIGALVADPATPTVALVGDSGLLYTAQELATAVELGLPLVVVLWNNDALGQIRDDMVARDIEPISVTPRNPDFCALAAAFGLHVERPASLPDIGASLRRAFAAGGPAFVEIHERALS